MEVASNLLPSQLLRRAATAEFIVNLELYFSEHTLAQGYNAKPMFASLPVPPDHLDREAVEECRAIASMLTLARKNKYVVTWDAEAYANDLKRVALPNPEVEDRLMVKYPPLLGVDGVLAFHAANLPVIEGPAIVTDNQGRVLVWSLPGILSSNRQKKILAATRCLEAQLHVNPHGEEEPSTKNWRTDDTFFNPGIDWKSGSTLLYPAGFQQGHTGAQFQPAPSAKAKSARAHDWMVSFEESGGLLDGIHAVTHPNLYRAAQDLMVKLSTKHAPSMSLMKTWPSTFTSVQVIANRQTPWHRDMSAIPGWLDLLLTIGTYGETAVLELKGLGISLPYDSGSVVSISSNILLHGAPMVSGDRICYAFYMNKAVFESFKVPLPGMASSDPSIPPHARVRNLSTTAAAGGTAGMGFATSTIAASAGLARPAGDEAKQARHLGTGGNAAETTAVGSDSGSSADEEDELDNSEDQNGSGSQDAEGISDGEVAHGTADPPYRRRHGSISAAFVLPPPALFLRFRTRLPSRVISLATMAHRRTLGPPSQFDEVSVERRHTKRGSRLVTKRTAVTFQSSAATSSGDAHSTAAHPPPQAANVPEPTGILDYNEVTFDDSNVRAPRKGKSQNDFQREYLAVQDEYIYRQLALEALPADGVGSCGHLALWRCLSCNARPTFCMRCCRESHIAHPLHRIEFWGGDHYRTAWLRQVGVQVHCGHGGNACPRLTPYDEYETPPSLPSLDANSPPPTPISLPSMDSAHLADVSDLDEVPYMVDEPDSEWEDEDGDFLYGTDPAALLPTVVDLPWVGEAPRTETRSRKESTYRNDRMIVVVDIEGVHELPFTFCACPNAPRDDIQLLELGYYPASSIQPRTVFTARVLDDFLLANKECKTAARNYYNKLRRTTNAAFPHMVPDRYKELLRVSRQWRNQQMRKNAGFGHRSQPIGPGDLAVRCPACPQPDVNLPAGWETDEHQCDWSRCYVEATALTVILIRWKYTRPEDDVALADGHAFMVTDAPYKEHLKTAAEYHDKITCNDHRAVLTASLDRANLEATGIGAAACSRHGFFAPHACVDFQQGERQRNMDYILHWIFAYLNGLRRILILYDIMCQYFVHFYKRFAHSPHLHIPPGLKILRGIGQFHVHGHISQCFPRFSLNFIAGAGVQDGEIIETLWNKTNAVADSTRGMSAAHRREVIDDHMNDSNWTKLTRIRLYNVATLLTRKWRRACKEWQPATTALEDLTSSADPTKVAQWRQDATAADEERHENVSVMDIYDVSATPLPSRKEVQVMLGEEELSAGAGAQHLGASDWIATGLKIEETKLLVAYAARQVKATSGSQTRLSLIQQRQRLASSIAAFHKAGQKHMPGHLPGDGGEMMEDLTAFGSEWDEETGDRADGETDIPLNRPETHPLGLPSTFGIEFLSQTGMLELAKKERQLREGQLNDALQGIRTGIGYKSLLYRSRVRNASSYRAKLRSFDDVHVADEGVRKHVRVYNQARRAIQRLFDPNSPADVIALRAFQDRYKEIQKQDLRASTAVLESFTPGLRNEHSAWFWNVSDTPSGEDSQWMQDCTYDRIASFGAMLIGFMTDRRMLWLRAFARKTRWDEELELVQFEMDCTVRSFSRKAEDWEGWTGLGTTAGHIAFAHRQRAMWLGLRDHAAAVFAAERTTYRP
uniref:Cell surface hydrophobicity-associated protein n=1 Tax=Ganoderma boninense TaxID=34458 RepID=A0A5K1K6H8_9APHY